jgi:hypothetical protein
MKQLNVHDIAKRIARLEALARGLADEAGRANIYKADGALTREEAAEYVAALTRSVTGLALGRGVLVAVHKRLEEEAK